MATNTKKLANSLTDVGKTLSAIGEELKKADTPTILKTLGSARAACERCLGLVSTIDETAEAVGTEEERRFLELESRLRELGQKHGWAVHGQWPTFHFAHAIEVRVNPKKRTLAVSGETVSATDINQLESLLRMEVKDLLPKSHSPQKWVDALYAAYQNLGQPQAPINALYRAMVLNMQSSTLWEDARKEVFRPLSRNQFRARLSNLLTQGVSTTSDGLEMRLLPPLHADDGLFLYQPAENRFGFVGRVQFVKA